LVNVSLVIWHRRSSCARMLIRERMLLIEAPPLKKGGFSILIVLRMPVKNVD
jgi:hypothetical protein